MRRADSERLHVHDVCQVISERGGCAGRGCSALVDKEQAIACLMGFVTNDYFPRGMMSSRLREPLHYDALRVITGPKAACANSLSVFNLHQELLLSKEIR